MWNLTYVCCTATKARVAELVDVRDLGSRVRKDVRVQVPPLAPYKVPIRISCKGGRASYVSTKTLLPAW